MKKVLITGASGFVGSFLVAEFLDRGFEVYAAVRASSDRVWLGDNRIRFMLVDFDQPDELRRQLTVERFDYIVHNAGITKADRKDIFFKVNASYTQRLAEISLSIEKKPEKFIFISSLAAYGPADQHGEEVKESDIPNPITTYGESKLAAEKALKAMPGLPYVIIRPTAVYGPREKDILSFFSLVNKGLEPYIGFSQQQLTFIYVKDLTKAIADLTLSQEIQRKAYFISDGQTYSAQDLGKLSRQFLGKKTLRFNVPLGLVRVIAHISETVGRISGKSAPLNLEKVRELESLNWKCDIRALKQDIGFQPAFNLEAGLRETIKWYQQHNWL